jgi:hypothetical protein
MVGGCGSKGSQSFRDGMVALCSVPDDIERVAPADRQQVLSERAAKRVSNREARNVLEALGAIDPQDRVRILREEATRAGLTACPLADAITPSFPADVTQVMSAVEPFDSDLPRVTITREELRFRDFAMRLDKGRLAPDQRDEPLALRISPLVEALGPAGDRLTMFVAPDVPYDTLIVAAYNATRAGASTIDLVAEHPPGNLGVVPIVIPKPRKPEAFEPSLGSDEALGMVVSVVADELRLWSTTGVEGTLVAPRASWRPTGPGPTFDLAPLAARIDEIVTQRWRGRDRHADTQQIVIQADAAIPFATVVGILAVVRVTPTGEARFPDVQLSLGFR